MNRSNSFVSSLKWWPLQGHNSQSNGATPTTPVSLFQGGNGNGTVTQNNINSKSTTFGSSVAVQKLRESKWFKRDEQRIFCAVVECGFIVEVRQSAVHNNNNNVSSSSVTNINDCNSEKHENLERSYLTIQDENETPVMSWFGITLCKTAKDNKSKPETIEIYSVKIRENGTFKMVKTTLEDVWSNGWELRINNFGDKEKQAHNEKDIRNQVSFARKAKQSLWNNNKHFVFWCRYGSRQQDVRKRQMSECVKWGSVGMNAGMLLVMNKQKSFSSSK